MRNQVNFISKLKIIGFSFQEFYLILVYVHFNDFFFRLTGMGIMLGWEDVIKNQTSPDLRFPEVGNKDLEVFSLLLDVDWILVYFRLPKVWMRVSVTLNA